MAEYKTYTCDVCGKQDAIHLEMPDVDFEDDPAGGRREGINGMFDLCAAHVPLLLSVTCSIGELTQEKRRLIWKRILDRKTARAAK